MDPSLPRCDRLGTVCEVCCQRWSGGDWRIGRVGKSEEAREMRQSAWLKRLDCDATRPATTQSSSRSGACSCHRTKQTIRNQMNQLSATRREMLDCKTLYLDRTFCIMAPRERDRSGACWRRTGVCGCKQSLPRIRSSDRCPSDSPSDSPCHYGPSVPIPESDAHRVAGDFLALSTLLVL